MLQSFPATQRFAREQTSRLGYGAKVVMLSGDGLGPKEMDCNAWVTPAVFDRASITLGLANDLMHSAAQGRYDTFCASETLRVSEW